MATIFTDPPAGSAEEVPDKIVLSAAVTEKKPESSAIDTGKLPTVALAGVLISKSKRKVGAEPIVKSEPLLKFTIVSLPAREFCRAAEFRLALPLMALIGLAGSPGMLGSGILKPPLMPLPSFPKSIGRLKPDKD